MLKKLVIVPHSDDEILLTGGIIHRACLEGDEIRVAVVTNGDYEAKDKQIGYTRLRESIDALTSISVSKENIYFLGYADTGMETDKSFLYSLYNESDIEKIHKSYVGTETYALPEHPEFHFLRHGKHQTYCRRGFSEDLKEFIGEFLPDDIYTTSRFDMHGDHSGLFCFVRDAIKELIKENNNYNPTFFEGFIHSVDGDDSWPLLPSNKEKLEFLTEPKSLKEKSDLCWNERISVEVPDDMKTTDLSKNLKHQAMLKYKSALKPEEPEVISFLLSFVKADEVFFKVNLQGGNL